MIPMESPPNSKKLLLTLTRSRPSDAAQTSASTRSVSVAGATNSSGDSAAATGAGNAARFTLPLGRSGRLLSTTNAEGIMYSGSSAFSFARNAGTNSRASLSPRGLFAYAANETSGRVSSVDVESAKELPAPFSETSDTTASKQRSEEHTSEL